MDYAPKGPGVTELMSRIIDEVVAVLTESDYRAFVIDLDESKFVAFENSTLFGFVMVYSTVAELIESWTEDKDQLIRKYSNKLLSSGSKAWNVYNVFLTSEHCTDIQFHALQDIEEDLAETRKIARSNIETADDVRAALLSLLPFSYIPKLPPLNIKEEIALRAQEVPQSALQAFFQDQDVEDVARILENT